MAGRARPRSHGTGNRQQEEAEALVATALVLLDQMFTINRLELFSASFGAAVSDRIAPTISESISHNSPNPLRWARPAERCACWH